MLTFLEVSSQLRGVHVIRILANERETEVCSGNSTFPIKQRGWESSLFFLPSSNVEMLSCIGHFMGRSGRSPCHWGADLEEEQPSSAL